MNCKQAREIAIDQIAMWLNIALGKRKNNEIWCFSPFRNEKTPSFKLNLELNTWVDFGDTDKTGCEKAKVVCGDAIELVKRINNCTTPEALEFIALNSGNPSYSKHAMRNQIPITRATRNNLSEEKKDILKITEIQSKSLLKYATKRRIPHSILFRFCKEIHYFNYKKRSAIGILNESNNWEINAESSPKNFQRCFGRKDISLINPGRNAVWVTEGFFDFLSLLVLRNQFGVSNDSFLILNGVGQVRRSIEFLTKYQKVNLVLDNDEAGKIASKKYQKIFRNVEDFSFKYQNVKDLNEYLVKCS